jgi:hypothetical protein
VARSKFEARKVPLSLGPCPSIRLVEAEDGDLAQHDINIAIDLLNNGERNRSAGGRWPKCSASCATRITILTSAMN